LSPLVVYGVAKSPGLWARIAGLFERGAERGIKTPTGIATPYGVAQQAGDAASLAARSQVEAGASLYRFGTTGRSQTAEAQFWALEHPLSAGYGNRYGIPAENIANANF